MRWVQVPGMGRRPRWWGYLVSRRRLQRMIVWLPVVMLVLGPWNIYRDLSRYDGSWLLISLGLDAVLMGWGYHLLRKGRRLQREAEADRWEEASRQDDPITALAMWDVLDRASYTALSDAWEWMIAHDGETWVGTYNEFQAMIAGAPRTVQALVLAGMPPTERRVD